MGYTHYWSYDPEKIEDTEKLRRAFASASRKIKKAAAALSKRGVVIRGGLGEGRPVFNETEIWFNGSSEDGMDHETFDIHWVNKGSNPRHFCKTARKPYDLLVCFALLTLREAFKSHPGTFSFSSDGGNSDWADAYEFYQSVTGTLPRKFPED